MASILNQPNGRKTIEFYVGAQRYRLALGKTSQKDAAAFVANLDKLIFAHKHNQPNPAAVRWADELDAKVRDVLERAGLVTAPLAYTLEGMLSGFLATLKVKASTMLRLKQMEKGLLDYFGRTLDPRVIIPLNGEMWRKTMESAGLAQATISKRVKDARRAFAWGVEMGIVDKNPLAKVRAGDESNPERNFFVTREVTLKVLDACPDAEWRLLVVLSRYGGLRCPSEHLALRWEDVLWDQNKIRVREGKTKERWVKLFPELEKALLDVGPGGGHVIERYRDPAANLRTQFQRIIRRAGVTPWPRIWHNLRASRQTELVEEYPLHVACAWVGNSEAVARKHYLMIPEHYYADARGENRGEQPVAQPVGSLQKVRDKMRSDAKNAVGHRGKGSGITPTGIEPPRRRRGLEGRPDQNGGIPGELLAMSDEERMRRALAAIEAFCTGEVRK